MKIHIYDNSDLDQKRWDDFVFTSLNSEHYHLSGWGRIIQSAYRWPAIYFTAWEDSQLIGILPVVVMRKDRFISMPFLDQGGICADRLEVSHTLYEAVKSELGKRRGKVLDLRHRRDMGLPLGSYGDKVAMVLQLEGDALQMWTKFGSKLRNQIRKAEKEKLWSRWCGEEGIKDFYHVYSLNMRDLGSPPHSIKFFKSIMSEFPNTRILLVMLEKKVIGGGICLEFKDAMLVPWASSLRSHFRLCPNNLFYWEAIRTACEQGLRQFDFGRSSRDSGTYKFKKQWGVQEEPLCWQSNINGGDFLERSSRHSLDLAIDLWRKLPVRVTRFIGPPVRRRISN